MLPQFLNVDPFFSGVLTYKEIIALSPYNEMITFYPKKKNSMITFKFKFNDIISIIVSVFFLLCNTYIYLCGILLSSEKLPSLFFDFSKRTKFILADRVTD